MVFTKHRYGPNLDCPTHTISYTDFNSTINISKTSKIWLLTAVSMPFLRKSCNSSLFVKAGFLKNCSHTVLFRPCFHRDRHFEGIIMFLVCAFSPLTIESEYSRKPAGFFSLSKQADISELYASNSIFLLHVSNRLFHQQWHSPSVAGMHAGKSCSAFHLVPLSAGSQCSLPHPSSRCVLRYVHNLGFNLMFTIYSIAACRTNYSEQAWNRRKQSLSPKPGIKINGMKHCLISKSPGSEYVAHCRTQWLGPVSYFTVFDWFREKKENFTTQTVYMCNSHLLCFQFLKPGWNSSFNTGLLKPQTHNFPSTGNIYHPILDCRIAVFSDWLPVVKCNDQVHHLPYGKVSKGSTIKTSFACFEC